MNKIFKTLVLVMTCFLLVFSQKTNIVTTHASEVSEFYNEFNDLSSVDIGYGKGNNTTFISHDYTYYASSFSYNCVNKELQFGRSTTATTNITDEDELRMEFDLSGYIEYVKLDIGTVNINRTGSNIEFKVQYSTDFGKTYNDVEGSLKTIVGNETYSLLIDDSFESIRYKFVISNVNGIAGKNMVIKNMHIVGRNLYAYSISHLVEMIDNCTCDNIRLNYENIIDGYNKLSENEKEIFNKLLTEDGQTTYKERLDYILNLCAKGETSSNGNDITSNNLSSVGTFISKDYLPFVYVIIALILVTLGYFLVYKSKSKKKN